MQILKNIFACFVGFLTGYTLVFKKTTIITIFYNFISFSLANFNMHKPERSFWTAGGGEQMM